MSCKNPEFSVSNGLLNPGQKARAMSYLIRKKTTCYLLDFAVLPDQWVKIKESEKTNKYLDLARELEKLWDLMVTVILWNDPQIPE